MAKADMFIKFDGIDGESQVVGFEKNIQIDSFAWGVHNMSSMDSGGGGGLGKAQFQDFSFNKYADKATSALMEKCAKGEHIATAKLVARKADGSGNPLEYYVAEFEKVFITTVTNAGMAAGGNPNESVAFTYEKIKLTYTEQNNDGTAGGTSAFGWDIKQWGSW